MKRRRLTTAALFVAFVVVPLVEIYVLIQVGQVIGAWWTIGLLVLDSLLGTWLIKREGSRAWAALRTALGSGRMPARELSDAAAAAVDAAGGVVRRRDAAGAPVFEAVQLAQLAHDGARAGVRLAFELHQVQLRNVGRLGPQVRGQAHLGDGVAVEVERETFDGAGAEVPAGDDGVRGDVAQGLGHKNSRCVRYNVQQVRR